MSKQFDFKQFSLAKVRGVKSQLSIKTVNFKQFSSAHSSALSSI